MGTTNYHGSRLFDPFDPELSPAAWGLTKWATPEGTMNSAGTLDLSVKEDLDGAFIQEGSRLLAKIDQSSSLADRYASLMSISAALRAHHAIDGLFSALATELSRVVNFDFIGIAQQEESTGRVGWHASWFGGGIERGNLDGTNEQRLSEWIHAHQKPLIVPFLDHETRLDPKIEELSEQGLRSLCAFPLTCVHHRIGSFFIGSKQPDAYSEREIRFLSSIAEMVASMVHDAMSLEALEKAQTVLQDEKERLKLLLELNNQVVSSLELRALLRTVAASIRRVMHCEAVGIHLPDSEKNGLELYALDLQESNGSPKEDCPAFSACKHASEVFRTRKPVLMSRPCSEPCCSSNACTNRSARPGEWLKSCCALPLISHERVLGVLELGRHRGPAFTQADVDFLVQATNQVAIAIENALAYNQITELKNNLAREKLYLENELRNEKGFEEIIGRSAAIRAVLRNIETVAATDSTVLICGETGTGKELVARAIHERSPRRSNPFVKLNCAAIPTGLLESELFGHEKGAFTGAIMQRTGRFELANHGTAFLDEIGEISLELQPKLLRVLQEREFERLGSTRTLKTDARLIAATNRDLAECVAQQVFRADLFYRLNVFPIHLPPLRHRTEDIPLLVRHFAQHFARQMNRKIDTIPSETMEALVQHSWPGNIRELQNLIEHSVILSQGPVLRVPLAGLNSNTVPGPVGMKQRTMEEAEREHVLATLKETKWVVSGPRGAAARLGMNRSTLQFRMKRLGIVRPWM